MAAPEILLGSLGDAPDDSTPVGLLTLEDLVAVMAKRFLAVCLVVPGDLIDRSLVGKSLVHLRGVDSRLNICCFSRVASEAIRAQWRSFVEAGQSGGLSVCPACVAEYHKH